MSEVFDNATTAKIDAKLHRDILAHEDNIEKIIIVIVIALIIIFRGWIAYWLKFGVAIPSGYEIKQINVIDDPIQTDYPQDVQTKKTFTYKSLINNSKMTMIPQAHYVLSGTVVAYNHDFLFVNEFFDSASLYDIGIAWGELSDADFFKEYIKIYSQKVEFTGSRRLNWEWDNSIPLSADYINSHISHTHLIPANKNVMAALLKIKLYEKVSLEGELVDITYPGTRHSKYYTSLSRSDSDASSRGSGACEAMYVTKVKIGNTIYK